jgi:hypothetical protein
VSVTAIFQQLSIVETRSPNASVPTYPPVPPLQLRIWRPGDQSVFPTDPASFSFGPLREGKLGLTKGYGSFLSEAASYCLHLNEHLNPVVVVITGDTRVAASSRSAFVKRFQCGTPGPSQLIGPAAKWHGRDAAHHAGTIRDMQAALKKGRASAHPYPL